MRECHRVVEEVEVLICLTRGDLSVLRVEEE